MTLNDLESQRSLSQNDLDNMKVRCAKLKCLSVLVLNLMTIIQRNDITSRTSRKYDLKNDP